MDRSTTAFTWQSVINWAVFC